jgi:hypothetical protein
VVGKKITEMIEHHTIIMMAADFIKL